MDNEWALSELRAFIVMTALVLPPNVPGVTSSRDRRRTQGEAGAIVASAQVVEKILGRTVPYWRRTIAPDLTDRWMQHREAAQRAVVEIERAEEIQEKLGDSAPQLSASVFHPWVWEGARSLWSSGHRAEAVRAAATKVNAELQNKVSRRDIADTKLIQESFSDDPPAPGKPRLRLPDDDGGQTARSFRQGVLQFGSGSFMAIRNPLSHELGDLGEQEALELLAALSVLSRWIDSATLVLA